MLSHDLLSGAKAAAEYTGLSERAIYHMVEKDQLPVTRKGRKIYFRKSELDATFCSSE